MSNAVEQALDRFIRATTEQPQALSLPRIEQDPLWPSPCLRGEPDTEGMVDWQPTRQSGGSDMFERLESALETPIHPDIKAYYQRFWSDPLAAHSPEGQLNLLFVWNDEDYERLRANLVGHALGRIKLKQPLSLFFGCTYPEEYVLAIDNSTGQVMLEQPGKKFSNPVAASLAEFLDRLEPCVIET
ncbi:MAG: SecY interacting protein Syd [Motiliproteus sp.]|jgi:SecY interacting protein Syd